MESHQSPFAFDFEQARFKQNLILMNQKSRQELKNSVEKDFYKWIILIFVMIAETILATADLFQFLTNIKN